MNMKMCAAVPVITGFASGCYCFAPNLIALNQSIAFLMSLYIPLLLCIQEVVVKIWFRRLGIVAKAFHDVSQCMMYLK